VARPHRTLTGFPVCCQQQLTGSRPVIWHRTNQSLRGDITGAVAQPEFVDCACASIDRMALQEQIPRRFKAEVLRSRIVVAIRWLF